MGIDLIGDPRLLEKRILMDELFLLVVMLFLIDCNSADKMFIIINNERTEVFSFEDFDE